MNRSSAPHHLPRSNICSCHTLCSGAKRRPVIKPKMSSTRMVQSRRETHERGQIPGEDKPNHPFYALFLTVKVIRNFLLDLENGAIVRPSRLFAKRFFFGGLPTVCHQHRHGRNRPIFSIFCNTPPLPASGKTIQATGCLVYLGDILRRNPELREKVWLVCRFTAACPGRASPRNRGWRHRAKRRSAAVSQSRCWKPGLGRCCCPRRCRWCRQFRWWRWQWELPASTKRRSLVPSHWCPGRPPR